MSLEYWIYDKLAKRYGLRMQPHVEQGVLRKIFARGDILLDGVVQQKLVRVHRAVHQWDDGLREGVLFACELPNRLDLGLSLKSAGLWHLIKSLVGRQERVTGDDDFDGLFVIGADEPQRAGALLDAEVRRSLRMTNDHWVLTDARCSILAFPPWPQIDRTAWLERMLQCVMDTADAEERAAQQVPCASLLAPHQEVWRRLAARHGLALRTTPLALRGRVGGMEVHARTIRNVPFKYWVELAVLYDAPLGLGLEVRPAHPEAVPFPPGKEDITVGHAELDAMFLVHTAERAAAPLLLDRALADEILRIYKKLGHLALLDHSAVCTFPAAAADEALMTTAMEEIGSLCKRVQSAAMRLRASPFRV